LPVSFPVQIIYRIVSYIVRYCSAKICLSSDITLDGKYWLGLLTDDKVLLSVDIVRRPLDGDVSDGIVSTIRWTRIPATKQKVATSWNHNQNQTKTKV